MVLLVSKSGAKREFETGHAERLLGVAHSQWSLPEDTDLEFKKGKIVKKKKKASEDE